MFRLVKPETITLSVKLSPPGGPAGEIRITMRYLGRDERVEYQQRIAEENLYDQDIVDDLLVGWAGLADEQGQALDFSDESRRREVLDLEYVWIPVRNAVLQELLGSLALEKN